MSDTPFEMRAGVRVFIVKPREEVPFIYGDEGGLLDQHFKATLVSQHSKDRWWATTDAGERILLGKADVVALSENEPMTFKEQLVLWSVVLLVLLSIWLGLSAI